MNDFCLTLTHWSVDSPKPGQGICPHQNCNGKNQHTVPLDRLQDGVSLLQYTMVRHLRDTATIQSFFRTLILRQCQAELKAQFGDSLMSGDPLAEFYERVRLPKKSPGIYAVELEATLRTVEERMNKTQPWPNRNKMLTQQFMRGVRNEKITNRLAPMKPREMLFRELQIELCSTQAV